MASMAAYSAGRRAVVNRTRQSPHTVYELYDGHGRALYVGCSSNVQRRLADHRCKPWWPQVSFMLARTAGPYVSARAEESQRIRDLRPVHNLVCNPSSEWDRGGWKHRRTALKAAS